MLWIFSPRCMYSEVIQKIEMTTDARGCAVMFLNEEGLLEKKWLHNMHFPDYVLTYAVRDIKLYSPHQSTPFTRSVHTTCFIFWDKSVRNLNMQSRCFHLPARCPVCPGNTNRAATKVYYQYWERNNPDCRYKSM